jgi:hypothetical protein
LQELGEGEEFLGDVVSRKDGAETTQREEFLDSAAEQILLKELQEIQV